LRRQLNELLLEEVVRSGIWELADAYEYDIIASPGEQGFFDVQLLDRTRRDQIREAVPLQQQRNLGANMRLIRSKWLQAAARSQAAGLPEWTPAGLHDALAWMVLSQLPLTSNGKVDRRALPVLRAALRKLGEYVAPRSELEKILTEIWVQLLRIDQVGVQDDFFELGGHSLLATRGSQHVSDTLDFDVLYVCCLRSRRLKRCVSTLFKVSTEISMEGHESAERRSVYARATQRSDINAN